MQNRGKSQGKESGRLGKGKAKNPFFKPERKEEPKRTDTPKISKDPKILKINEKYKKGKITDLNMRQMGFIRNCELSFKTTYLFGIPHVDIICNTDYGQMSVAQYCQIYCGEGKEWEEEDERYVVLRFCYSIIHLIGCVLPTLFKKSLYTEF